MAPLRRSILLLTRILLSTFKFAVVLLILLVTIFGFCLVDCSVLTAKPVKEKIKNLKKANSDAVAGCQSTKHKAFGRGSFELTSHKCNRSISDLLSLDIFYDMSTIRIEVYFNASRHSYEKSTRKTCGSDSVHLRLHKDCFQCRKLDIDELSASR